MTETAEEEREITSKPEEEEEPASSSSANNNKRKRKRKRKKKEDGDGDGDNNENQADGAKPNSPPVPLTESEESKTKEVDRTIFVEGIPFTCTPAQVRDFFLEHVGGNNKDGQDGDEDNDNNIIADLRLPVWHDSGRLRGYGHVVFKNSELYQKALALNGKYMGNRYLNISAAHAPKSASTLKSPTTTVDHSNPSTTVSLHNLSYDASEEDIHAVMSKYGEIADGGVRIVRHSHTGLSKGFGYVTYTEISAAQKAVKTVPCIIAGRACRLDYDHGRVRGSFRTADRKLWHKEFTNNNNKRPRGADGGN